MALLNTATSSSDTRVDIQDDGSLVISDASILNFAGSEFDVTNPSGETAKAVLTTGGVANSKLTNSSITVAGTSVSLGGSVSIALADLSNVGTVSTTDGHVIASDGTDFDSEGIASVVSAHVSSGDLSDITLGTQNAGELLIWDATNNEWVNATLTGGNAIAVTNADGSITLAVDSNSIGSSELTNDSVTVAGNSVALGNSTTVAAGDLSNINLSTPVAGGLLIYDATNNEFIDATLTGGNAIGVTNADGSVTLDVSSNSIQTGELDLSITPAWTGEHDYSSGGIILPTATSPSPTTEGDVVWDSDDDVLRIGDGASTVTLDPAGGSSQLSDLSDASTSSETAGQLLIWNATNNQYENAGLTGGDAISVTDADASVTVAVSTDGIQTDEIDQSIAPTWTGSHDFSGGGIIAPTATTPSPTTEGELIWDSDDDVLRIGDGSSTVTLDPSVSDTRTDIEDSGTSVVTDVTSINFNNNLTVTDDTDGSVTVDASGGSTTRNLPKLSDIGNDVTATKDALSFRLSEERIFDPTYVKGPTHGEGDAAFRGRGTPIPDGRVIFPPAGSSSVGIFDPADNSYTSGPTHGLGSNAFSGSTLLPDGRVLLCPYSQSTIGLFDPSDDSFTNGPTADSYRGVTMGPNGKAILAPHDANSVGIFDPSNDSFTSGPTHGEADSFAFDGAITIPDGRVVFAPRNSSNVGLYDPSTDTYTSGPTHGEGTSAFNGGVLAPDGRVIFSPGDSTNVGIFDPSNDSYTSGPSISNDGFKYRSPAVGADGRVYFPPYNEPSETVGIFDPSDDTFTDGPTITASADSSNQYFGGITMTSDGRLVFMPYDSNEIGILETYTQSPSSRSTSLHPLINS